MKLFMKPGACSLASHIVLREVGARFDLDPVDTVQRTTSTGADFTRINPKGYVPALELENGDILTEGAAILQYIADTHPGSRLAPEPGTVARARLQEYLNYTASELHKSFGPYFHPGHDDAAKQTAGKSVAGKFDYVESLFADGRAHLLGTDFSVADAYLFVVSNWANFVGIDLTPWPKLSAFLARVAARPSVRAALAAEGLV